ncbi:hypothetical protein [Calidifontibacter terrae]
MGWMVVDAFGSTIRVDVAQGASERLREQWSRCLVDDTRLHDATVRHEPGSALERDYPLSTAVTLAAITAQAGRTLMVHACGVADPTSGRVATLVAASGTGKTTAARTLATAGLGYVSDETVAIDAEGTVRPYPKPLSRVVDPQQPYRKEQLSPDELGLAAPPSGRLVPGPFVLLRRDPLRTAGPTLAPIDLIDGMLDIIPQTSALPSMATPLATLAGVLAAGGGAFALDYAEFSQCTELIRDLLAQSSEIASDVEHLPPSPKLRLSGEPAPLPGEDALLPGVELRRAVYTDAVMRDGRVLTLHGPRVSLLGGIGTILWLASERFTSLSHLRDLCVAEAGDHPDADRLVGAAALELFRNGTLIAR